MIDHKYRFVLILVLVPTIIIAIVLLVLFGEGNELAARVLGWLEGAGLVLVPALVDSWAEKRRRARTS